eukprot:2364937-Ditylum_brightwellii.AAC.1
MNYSLTTEVTGRQLLGAGACRNLLRYTDLATYNNTPYKQSQEHQWTADGSAFASQQQAITLGETRTIVRRNMYSSRRRRYSSPALSRSGSCSSVGKSSVAGSTSSQKDGDYQLLHNNLQNDRRAVQQARSKLASTLVSLGEHHVRKREYDEAMDAFTEALLEQRHLFQGSNSADTSEQRDDFVMSSPSFQYQSSSFLEEGNNHKILDDMITTLSNIGNVHSLRGEHSDAMKYYTEVMNIRATRSNLSSPDARSTGVSGSGSSALSGLSTWTDEDSSLITDLDEDVKALDDMFRRIAFRNGDMPGVGGNENEQGLRCAEGNSRRRRRRQRQKSELPSIDASDHADQEECNASGGSEMLSPAHSETKVPAPIPNTLNDAIDMYRSVLDTYTGQNLEIHEKHYLSFLDKIKTLFQRDEANDRLERKPRREEELQLALDIYKNVLSAQRDMIPSSSPIPSIKRDISAVDRSQQASVNVASTLITMGTRKNIGMVLAERGEYDAAMSEFKKARNIYMSLNDKGSLGSRDIASALSCIGNVQNRRGNLDDALKYYRDALGIYRRVMIQSEQSGQEAQAATQDVTSTLKIIGMVHAKQGELDQAMECFQEAMDLLRSR